MSEKENNIDSLLNQWNNGELTDDEFKAQIGEDEFLKYQSIIQTVDNWTPSLDEEIFDPKMVTSRLKKSKQINLFSRTYLSVAASLLLIIGMGIFFYSQPTRSSSSFGEVSEILLPDGKSKVILSPNSQISWSKRKWAKGKRDVTLVGKAHFMVEKGAPFIVHTAIGTVEVLGTTFDVGEYGETLEMACYTGKIKGTMKESDQFLHLAAPRRATYRKGKWSKVKNMSESKPTWTGDETKYTDTPLEIVLQDLSNRYNIEVKLLDKHKDRKFTGVIPNNNLDNCLKLILIPLSIKYELKGKTLYLLD
jgi:ferric-dicitrate binding protein FerR (iron transport regulator)